MIDKRIPLTLIAMVLLQTFGALIWTGAASERISHTEAEVARVQDLAERAVRLEAPFCGFPYMPGNDAVIAYPNRTDGNLDGKSRYGN